MGLACRPGFALLFVILIGAVCFCLGVISFSCKGAAQNPFGWAGCWTPEYRFFSIGNGEADSPDSPPREDPQIREDVEEKHRLISKDPLSSSTSAPAEISSYDAFDRFAISPLPCSNSTPPFVLLIVFTRPDAFLRRDTIRRTYGSLAVESGTHRHTCSHGRPDAGRGVPLGFRLLFIVGLTVSGAIQRGIADEAARTGDIIQTEAFVDDYGQATRKGLALIHWSLLHCPQATFVAKADDDCFINPPLLLSSLRHAEDKTPSILGHFWPAGAPVIRDPKNKWAVPVADFPEKHFPPYMSGILYTFHRLTLAPLAHAARTLKYLWHDDVFLTGLAARAAQIPHIGLGGYDPKGGAWNKGCSKGAHLAVHYVDDSKMWKMWNDTCVNYVVPC
ncbi:beta-1,3-galactosyltransferase 9-like [Paramacrobiotus metropolitanus]|uniref:beta-1,3-galactosyltransferase 9-like n=1 Tax=Paramacrobiotus metropolitanus TaxID=2943436 RepID=UPI002445EEAE|nr:beta-1,3-galactosyltransferase 9-like [Paramacrobiotus metropolitanus]